MPQTKPNKPNDAFGGAKASLFAPSIPTASAGALNLFGGGAPAPAAPFGTAATPKAGAPATAWQPEESPKKPALQRFIANTYTPFILKPAVRGVVDGVVQSLGG